MNYEAFTQFGLAGIMLFLLIILLQWMMKLHDRVMNDSKEERLNWQSVIGALKESINTDSRASALFHEQVLQGMKREREEHERILAGQQHIVDSVVALKRES